MIINSMRIKHYKIQCRIKNTCVELIEAKRRKPDWSRNDSECEKTGINIYLYVYIYRLDVN